MLDKVPLTWWDIWGGFFARMFVGFLIATVITIIWIMFIDYCYNKYHEWRKRR